MPFHRFKFLIKKRALYFARADQFDDPLEGTFPKGSLSLFPALKVRNLTDFLSKTQSLRKSVVANCWNMNDNESLNMWRRYTNNGEGVVLRSTYARLKKSISNYTDDSIRIVKIQYINFSKAILPPVLGFPFEFKDELYLSEKELRCIIYRQNTISEKGIIVPVDINILIGVIYISPFAPIHFQDSVRDMMAKYGQAKQIFKSRFTEN